MIVIVGCGKDKLDESDLDENGCAQAWALYTGPIYRAHMALARRMPARRVMILSAKYGLIDPSKMIKTYDTTLAKMPKAERVEWAERVAAEVVEAAEPKELVVVLAGKLYLGFAGMTIDKIRVVAPLAGMQAGERLSVVKAWTNGKDQAHDLTRPYGSNAAPSSSNERDQKSLWGWFACDSCGHRHDAWSSTCDACGHRGVTRTSALLARGHGTECPGLPDCDCPLLVLRTKPGPASESKR